MTPSPWAFALFALAAFRVWRLLAEDTLLDPLRYRLVRGKLAEFVSCPYCLGAWVAVGWWAAWYWLSSHWTLVVAVPFALSATLAAVALAVDALAQSGE